MSMKNENKGLFSVKNENQDFLSISVSQHGAATVLPALVTKITPDIEDEFIKRAEQGMTTKAICHELGVDFDAILSHQKKCQFFQKRYASARNEGLEALADSLLDISSDESDVLRARLKTDNIRWLLSKRKANVYGDKLEVNMNATVDIASALSEARSRALLAPAVATDNKELLDLLS